MVRKSSASSSQLSVTVSQRGASRLKDGHVWVYRSDIVSAGGVPPGAVISVTDPRGQFLGTALYSTASQIAVRLISRDPVDDFLALLRQRVSDAIAYRQPLVQNTDACRLIFSEADFLPGLIVDKYKDILSLQILTQAMDAETVRENLLSALSEKLNPASIVERVDPKIRQLEQLPPQPSRLLVGGKTTGEKTSGEKTTGEKTSTVFTMNGVQFHFDALEGQKTGAFLDQRENYAAAAQYARGMPSTSSAIREDLPCTLPPAANISPAWIAPVQPSK